IIAYGMVSIWLTKVKGHRQSAKTEKRKKPTSRDEVDFVQMRLCSPTAPIGDIAGFVWCAGRQGRADRWKTARTGIRRRSACSGCKLPRGTASRREPRQRLRPCDGKPTPWSRVRAGPQSSADYRQAR